MFIVSALRRVFRPREQRSAGIVVERNNDQGFAVKYPYNVKVFNIWNLRTQQEARLVCDMLALKESFDAQLNVAGPLPLGAADALQVRLYAPYCQELNSFTFCEAVQQLQACAFGAAKLSPHPGSAGGRLLCAAAGLDLAAATQLLLLADLEAARSRNSALRTPMHYAAQNGHTATCQLLLDAAPHTVTSASTEGYLPLYLAADNGHTAICQLLLDAAPLTITAASTKGHLPLHAAPNNGHTETCQLLLDRASQTIAAADNDGWLPLHWAANSGQTATCQLLLDRAPHTVTAANSKGCLPLHAAAGNGHMANCRLLLNKAPHTRAAADNDGWLPLHWAANSGHTATCQLLLDRAAYTVTAASNKGYLPLHYAVDKGHTASCQLLLAEAPETALMPTLGGSTSLQLALAPAEGAPYLDVARLLLAAGPAPAVLAALSKVPAAGPLYADFVTARLPLTADEWAAVPSPCPGLGSALPTTLAHSTKRGSWCSTWPQENPQRLRIAAMSLHRAQTLLAAPLPAPIVSTVLALSCAA